MGKPTVVFTIGHSRHTWEAFRKLLKATPVEVLVDVRTHPVSRFAPFANKTRLPGLLEAEGIEHHWMGDTLGGKPPDPSLYGPRRWPDLEKMRRQPAFQKGIEALAALAQERVVTIMCAEEDPAHCHRALLIAPELERLGLTIAHIRARR
jgi:uncharacterized protein (DUF488 family)